MMFTSPIIAEVLDKEPSVASNWVLFGSMALIGFLVCRYWKWWLAPVFLAASLILGLIYLEEFSSVGLLRSSESPSYVAQFHVAAALAVLLPIIGAIINFVKYARN